MSSPARARASRANGARSRGPKTEAGKARSAANSLRHGLTARTVPLLGPEERQAHARLRDELFAHYRPEGSLETHWVERMVDAMWRQTRLELLENRVLESLIAGERPEGLPSLTTLCRYRARIGRDLEQARSELERLQEQRRAERARRAARRATPEQLRRFAELLESGTLSGAGTAAPETDAARGMNEPGSPSSGAAADAHAQRRMGGQRAEDDPPAP